LLTALIYFALLRITHALGNEELNWARHVFRT
jgi:hypothetical protein